MVPDASPTPVERLCHRYGPGRLPGADHPVIATGYAFATAALLTTVVWVLLAGPVTLAGYYFTGPNSGYNLLGLGALIALFFVPSAFLSGAAARYLPARVRRSGALVGVLAMSGAYVVGAVAAGLASLVGDFFFTPLGVAFLALVGGFIGTGWLSLPIGAAVGHVHQRAVAESVKPGVVSRVGHRVRAAAARALVPLGDHVVDGWTRYGSGRLPGGTRPAIGAGYAFAAVQGVLVLVVSGVAALQFEIPGIRWIAVTSGVFVPAAFAAGALAWSRLPDGLPYRGPICGAAVMAATSLVGATGVSLLAGVPEVTVAASVEAGIVALLYFGWLSLPLGAAVGAVHDRSLATTHTS